METVKDKTNNIVEIRYKILNKRKDGSTGSYLKFTINVYNTTSSLLINGQKVDIFTETILPILEVYIGVNSNQLDDINTKLKTVIKDRQPKSLNNMNNHQNEHCPKSYLGIENSRIQSQEQKYTCPSCSEEASLNTIGCEGCDEWYHYNCVGLTRADINKLDPNSPFICVSCNENDLYDPNSDNTIHPISASTEESSTPIILCSDQNDQVLQNQLSQPAPSSQPSITPLQSSDQPTPVCELSKDTPLTRPKSSSRPKNNKTVENRTYTLELEKRIKEQEKTINLLQKREKLIGGGETQNTFTNDQQPCQCAKPTYFQQSQTPLDYQYLNLQRQIEIQALESRLKAVETQSMQNLSIQTAMTTQLAIQIQQQTINRIQSQTVMPPYSMPTQMFFPPPPFQHGMQPPPYQPVFHHRHPSPTWHVPQTNFEPVYQQNTMGYTQPVPMNPSPFRTSKIQQNTNPSGTTNNHQLNNPNHHRNNFYSGRNNVRSQYTDTSRTHLESTITPQPSRLTTTESPCGNNQNNVQNVKDQSAWIFQAKLTSTDSDNQAKPVINSHEVNETFKQGSVQSAWEVQAKLTEAQINHHTQPSTGSKITNIQNDHQIKSSTRHPITTNEIQRSVNELEQLNDSNTSSASKKDVAHTDPAHHFLYLPPSEKPPNISPYQWSGTRDLE
ncbi:Hypothetical predicted protein [Mytilus galloprovincialis]|uniref:PHD-type domain-containing protein n=1 Tax=Mytilus galloprovincialis TaxID=29158 RepID=A0A8B6GYG2_MYTGA|nr:Hypothetical predicted protein [Mytilus galloprovincialis]